MEQSSQGRWDVEKVDKPWENPGARIGGASETVWGDAEKINKTLLNITSVSQEAAALLKEWLDNPTDAARFGEMTRQFNVVMAGNNAGHGGVHGAKVETLTEKELPMMPEGVQMALVVYEDGYAEFVDHDPSKHMKTHYNFGLQ